MSALDNLRKRLEFEGGIEQEQRMNKAKLSSLKRALVYSYQAQTAILTDGREFKCLINHDRLKEDYDDKIISIPYEDRCLNPGEFRGIIADSEIKKIGMKVGDTFTWKETNSKWIVIQEILEENAYFRGTIRRAKDEVIIDGKSYPAYIKRARYGDLWHTKEDISWSEMGYEVIMYVTADPVTRQFFHRFQKVKIKDRLWEVNMVDDMTSKTMLLVFMKETFTNNFYDHDNTNGGNSTENNQTPQGPHISGEDFGFPYDKLEFTIVGTDGGEWSVSDNKKAKIEQQNSQRVALTIVASKKGDFTLFYKKEGQPIIEKKIEIKSF